MPVIVIVYFYDGSFCVVNASADDSAMCMYFVRIMFSNQMIFFFFPFVRLLFGSRITYTSRRDSVSGELSFTLCVCCYCYDPIECIHLSWCAYLLPYAVCIGSIQPPQPKFCLPNVCAIHITEPKHRRCRYSIVRLCLCVCMFVCSFQ